MSLDKCSIMGCCSLMTEHLVDTIRNCNSIDKNQKIYIRTPLNFIDFPILSKLDLINMNILNELSEKASVAPEGS